MLEAVVLISCVVNVITLFIIFNLYSTVKSKELYISQVHSAVSHVLLKIGGLENGMGKLTSGVTDVINSYADLVERLSKPPSFGNIPADKFMSMEEFMDMVNGNGKNKKFDSMSQDEIDTLKNMFSSDEDEDDDEDEPYKK